MKQLLMFTIKDDSDGLRQCKQCGSLTNYVPIRQTRVCIQGHEMGVDFVPQWNVTFSHAEIKISEIA